MRKDVKTLECKLGPGAFSGQRTFEVTLADKTIHVGLAPRIYCWTRDGKHQPEVQNGETLEGLIAARVLKMTNGHTRVEIPDGEVVEVATNALKDLPKGDWDDVPL